MQKISKYKTAMTYAQAWFDAAHESHIEDQVTDEVRLLKDSFCHDRSLWNILAEPADDSRNKLDIVESLSQRIGLSELSAQTLKLVAENERINLLGFIFDNFIKLYYQSKGIIEVTVDCAVKLSAKQDEKLKEVLEEKLHSPVIIDYRIKPEVMGGLAIHFNSLLIDDTLAGKLKSLKQLLLNQRVA